MIERPRGAGRCDLECIPLVNAFKKAASSAEKLTYAAPWEGAGATATVWWVDDSDDKLRVVRRAERAITVKRHRGESVTIAKATFHKARKSGRDGKVDFTIQRHLLCEQELIVIEQWLHDVDTRYRTGLEWIDAQALRAVVRNYLTRRLKAPRLPQHQPHRTSGRLEGHARGAARRCGQRKKTQRPRRVRRRGLRLS